MITVQADVLDRQTLLFHGVLPWFQTSLHAILKPQRQGIWELGFTHLALGFGNVIANPLEVDNVVFQIENCIGCTGILIAGLPNTTWVDNIAHGRFKGYAHSSIW